MARFVTPDDFKIPRSDIIHANSGLILQYKSSYRPANKVIAISTSIPMVADMCYLVPIAALKQIPRCNFTMNKINFMYRNIEFGKELPLKTRPKRLIGDIISIGIGSAALALSTANTVQIASLKTEMSMVTESLRSYQTLQKANQASILHLSEGQMKIVEELENTQQALNRTMHLVNQYSDTIRTHDEAIKTLDSMSIQTSVKLNSFIHAVEGHFLHNSIENILENKLNLNFIQFEDIPKIIELILQKTNIFLEEGGKVMSLMDLVTRLLVQQQIHFIPKQEITTSPFGARIGDLIITSYFAACERNQEEFYVYKLIPIPFKNGNRRVQLAQMPAYIGLRPQYKKFIRWSEKEANDCKFEFMSSCRETPAIRKKLEDTCIYEILTDKPMTACMTEYYSQTTFIHQIGHHWVISTETETKCLPIKVENADEHKIMDNQQIIIPTTAIYSNPDSTSIQCDKFYLPGLPRQVGKTTVFIQNETINPIDKDLINLQSIIEKNTNWTKLTYIPSHIQEIMDFISNTTQPPQTLFLGYFSHSFMYYLNIFLTIMILGLISYQIYRRWLGKKKARNIMIKMPSMRDLEQLQNF